MEGRTDFAKYFNGATNIENFVVLPHGQITRRPGTYFVSEIKTSSANTRLIPFTFSTTQTYILELGNNYIRFFKDSGQIVESDVTISGITKANPGVVTANSHGFSNGDFVNISSVAGMTEVNNKTFKVANKATNTFQLTDIDGNNVKDIAKKFKVQVGFSDHSIGNVAATTAVALGAKIVEKHFTISKAFQKSSEKAHLGAMDETDLRNIYNLSNEFELIGNKPKKISD